MRKLKLVEFDFAAMPVESHCRYPFAKGDRFVMLGEIDHMPGHCVLARTSDGRVFCGYHTENFIEVEEEDL